ncbi:hypothetical protein [Pseudaestuariivita rosea]|uniref:hypothetical protein n=1 Tax=Pseudaestuariivita rosea TaxID=2763263 RepID=UPI001ABB474A|nr:hypothetical protein [Pseudaestuariivita rosea]
MGKADTTAAAELVNMSNDEIKALKKFNIFVERNGEVKKCARANFNFRRHFLRGRKIAKFLPRSFWAIFGPVDKPLPDLPAYGPHSRGDPMSKAKVRNAMTVIALSAGGILLARALPDMCASKLLEIKKNPRVQLA